MTTDLQRVMAEGAAKVVGGRPPGCPHRHCGCGASICICGKIIPFGGELVAISTSGLGARMVAARRGHVLVLRLAIRRLSAD